jgi:hypothetical protein
MRFWLGIHLAAALSLFCIQQAIIETRHFRNIVAWVLHQQFFNFVHCQFLGMISSEFVSASDKRNTRCCLDFRGNYKVKMQISR